MVRTSNIGFNGSDETWDAGRAKELATWARRLEALLGPDGRLESDFGYAEACIGERCVEMHVRADDPRALFDAVATALAIPRAQRAAALRVSTTAYAVQVAAVRDRALAEALATRLSAGDLPMGFYEAGGFPADNDEAHVMMGFDAAGAPVYRVVVGAFLDRSDAAARAAEVAAATGLPVLLRAL